MSTTGLSSLTGTDIAAIIGAFAWTPHVIKWIKNKLTTPKISLIVAKQASIGFTPIGPIFNVRLAFSVEYHDIVISDLKIHVEHEKTGEKTCFSWQGLKQEISTLTTPDGGVIPTEKQHSVLALKLLKTDIIERSVECQKDSFINDIAPFRSIVSEKQQYQQKNNTYNEDDFLKSKEMSDLVDFITQSFNWKRGKYNIKIEIKSSKNFKLVDNEYTMELDSIDISQLEQNKRFILTYFETEKEDKSNKVHWNWRNPYLIKSPK